VTARVVAVSVAIHIAIAIAIAIGGIASSRPSTIDIEIVPPPIVSTEHPPPPPPRVPHGPAGGSPVVQAAPPRRTPPARRSPTLRPAPVLVAPAPTAAADGDLAAPPGGETDGDDAGGDGGRGGGAGSGVGSGIDIDRSARPIPLNASTLQTLPYTEEAARAGISGNVVLVLMVDPLGHVGRVTLRRGLGHGLDEIAKKLAMQIKFRPALDRAGNPTVATVRWGFHFRPP
jgi:periplasmic protein TonB